jgi:hypothetical protein
MRTLFVRYRRVAGLASAFALALLLAGPAVWAGDSGDHRGPVKFLTAIPIAPTPENTTAGKLYSYDISWVDQATQTYYLADRSNKVVDVFDEKAGTLTRLAPTAPFAPFAGFTPCSDPAAGANDCAGPDGVLTAGKWLIVTDAPSRVLSIDTTTGVTVSEAFTKSGDPFRADELAYAPGPGLLLVINNADDPPFGTLIGLNKATGALTVLSSIILDAAHGVDAKNGAEQPVWDPVTGRFYLSIPQIGPDNFHGGVVRISTAGVVEAVYPVDYCSPAGLALGPKQQLLVGCNTVFDTVGGKWTTNADRDTETAAPQQVILDAKTGAIVANVLGVGAGDEVWFNKGDHRYYTASSGSPLAPNAITPARPPVGTAASAPTLTAQGAAVLGVINADSGTLDQLVPTLNVPAVKAADAVAGGHPAGTAHSVAANAENNHVFIPLAANNVYPNCLDGCIAVYGRDEENEGN